MKASLALLGVGLAIIVSAFTVSYFEEKPEPQPKLVNQPEFNLTPVAPSMAELKPTFIATQEQVRFFLFIKMNVEELTPQQLKVFAKLASNETTKSIRVVKFNQNALNFNQLHLISDPNIDIMMPDFKVTVDKETKSQTFKWNSQPNLVTFSFGSESGYGMVFISDKHYSIEPISNEIHAFIELDNTKFPKEK